MIRVFYNQVFDTNVRSGEFFVKKLILSLSVIFLLSCFLFACTGDQINLDDIDIEAIDRTNIPVGTYQIQYTIDDIVNLVENHGASVSFTVKNSANEDVLVTGSTFTVEANEVYTVKIKLTVGDTFKEKTITVTAVTVETTVLITFVLNGGNGSFPALTMDYGTTLNITTSPTKDGFRFMGWYFEDTLTTRYTNQIITSNISLYAKWEPVVIETAVVSFYTSLEPNQALDQALDQTVVYGSYATRPQDPVMEGYTFIGWFTDRIGGDAFNFEAHAIYQDTIIFAHWTEIITNSKIVTYNLNGAFQPEPITEKVEVGSSPVGPDYQFTYANHIFQGWSTDEEAEVAIDLSKMIITDSITLYAVWHIDFEVIDGTSYYQDHMAFERPEINDGFVEQRYLVSTFMHLTEIENDLSIEEARVSYGILYSSLSDVPSYYDINSKRHDVSFDEFDQMITIPLLEILTDPLLSETQYKMVSYVRFETTIVYSDVIDLKTYIHVPEGTAIGANYILNGGYFKYDSNTTAFRPSMYIEILDGFEAKLDGNTYISYSQLMREGIRRLVTKEIATGKEYLHVFHLDFQTPHVTITLSNYTDLSGDLLPVYGIVFPFEENINYPVSELGVLYSKTHPFLKLDVPGVHKKLASLIPNENKFETNSRIDSSRDDIYVRGYAIINGKVSYAKSIHKLVYNSASEVYETFETIDTTELKTTEEFGTSANYTPQIKRIYKVVGDEITYQDYPNEFTLTENGQYFVRNSDGTGMIDDILIIDDYPDVTGVSELAQYVGSVLITCDMYNPDWYYSLNDGDFVTLPAQIRLTVPGFYELYYRTGEGMEVINFEIVSEATE